MTEYVTRWYHGDLPSMTHGEEVVRCKDCRLSAIHDGKTFPKGKKYEGKMYCIAWGDGYQGEWTKPDGYCHRGKRREG